MLGDNFYTTGIHGTADSPRFEQTFEKVYDAPLLQNIPFYAVAGNHDHKGNVSAQIEYSKRSKRWTFPDYYHSIDFAVPATNRTVQIVLIDTVIGLDDPSEYPNGDLLDPHVMSKAQAQWEWLDGQLSASTADYLWVGGHYPVWSSCIHGPTSSLVKLLKPRLEAVGAHYMNGHDHCMGHYVENGESVNYVLTGSGYECCYHPWLSFLIPHNATKFLAAGTDGQAHQKLPVKLESGFVSLTFSQQSSKVTYYAQDGTALYTTPPIPPRSAYDKAAAAPRLREAVARLGV